MEWIVLWFGLAIAAGVIASSKGRSGFGYFVLGFFLPIVGVLIALGVPSLSVTPAANATASRRPGDLVLCHQCGKASRADANPCPYCGRSKEPPRPATKACPFCAETIQAAAIKCRFCGTDIGATLSTTPVVRSAAPETGYCPGCQKLRGTNVPKCLYCGDATPVRASAIPNR